MPFYEIKPLQRCFSDRVQGQRKKRVPAQASVAPRRLPILNCLLSAVTTPQTEIPLSSEQTQREMAT
jgi:hypothetical protein